MPDDDSCDEKDEYPLPWEPAGHRAIATINVANCAVFWRNFMRNPIAMTWIEKGYMLMWPVVAPERKEMHNVPSAMERNAFVPGAVV